MSREVVVLTTFWSVKGGVGVSSIAAMAALAHAARANPTLMVDLDGDQPAVFGLAEPEGPGVREWVATPGRSSEALRRIAVEATPDLAIVPCGAVAWPSDDASDLVTALAERPEQIVVDAGLARGFTADLVARSPRRLLVVRNCYLSLRAAKELTIEPTGIVLVRERGRALGVGDAESVTGAPVVIEVALDIAVARTLDAGVLASRPPRSLLRSLSALFTEPVMR